MVVPDQAQLLQIKLNCSSGRRIQPPRCTSAELFFSFCDSVAALPALANYIGRRGSAGNGPSTTIKYLRQTASDAAVNGLNTTMKYL
jgi:hypothetical protein